MVEHVALSAQPDDVTPVVDTPRTSDNVRDIEIPRRVARKAEWKQLGELTVRHGSF